MPTAEPCEILYGADVLIFGGEFRPQKRKTRFCPQCNPAGGDVFFCPHSPEKTDCLEEVRSNEYTLAFLLGNVL